MSEPTSFGDIIGQTRIMSLVKKECASGLLPRHMLFTGAPGLGKTTIAKLISSETGMGFLMLQASSKLTSRVVAESLMGLAVKGYNASGWPKDGHNAERYVVLVDECDKLTDFTFWHSILTGRELNPDLEGKSSWLPFITVIGTTNWPNSLPKAFRDRFPLELDFEPYDASDLAKMIKREYTKLTPAQASNIAGRSRGSARTALSYSETVLRHGLDTLHSLGIDDDGTLPMHRLYLEILETAGRPMSLGSIAARMRMDARLVQNEVEPYLFQLGRVVIGQKGRELVSLNSLRSRGNLNEFYAK
jgi:Holliday junction DNA helicase RuvB